MVPGCIQAEVLPLAVAAVKMSLTDVSLEKIITDNSTEEKKKTHSKHRIQSTSRLQTGRETEDEEESQESG